MKCPECHGAKDIQLICPPMPRKMPCPRCFGLGAVPDEQKEWIEVGKQMREDRLKRGHTLREESRRRKIDSLVLSNMERGIQLPIPPETKK